MSDPTQGDRAEITAFEARVAAAMDARIRAAQTTEDWPITPFDQWTPEAQVHLMHDMLTGGVTTHEELSRIDRQGSVQDQFERYILDVLEQPR